MAAAAAVVGSDATNGNAACDADMEPGSPTCGSGPGSPLSPSGLPPPTYSPCTPLYPRWQQEVQHTPPALPPPVWPTHPSTSTAPWCTTSANSNSGCQSPSAPAIPECNDNHQQGSPSFPAPWPAAEVTWGDAAAALSFSSEAALGQSPSGVQHISQLQQALSASNLRGQLLTCTVQELEESLRRARAQVCI